MLSFFGVANVDAWREGWEMPQFAFRKSPNIPGKVVAIATWLRLCENAAKKQECATKETYVDIEYADDVREQNANSFASNMLIPPSRAAELQRLNSHADVKRFAKSIGMAPGIVVSGLQRDKIIPYSHLNKLKVRLEWVSG